VVIDPVALAGVQDKASARMISVPLGRAGKRYILKVDPPEFPYVVQNEAYFIRRAALARFPVVGAAIVHDATGRAGLLVERFDRVSGPDGQRADPCSPSQTQPASRHVRPSGGNS
jgi:serine/threonine-protein kinase HipA